MKQVCLSLVYIQLLCGLIFANVINVPADIDSIQGGINLAANGDTVLVAPGTYVENINFNSKNIVVGSWFLMSGDTSYISQTIIDGDSSGSVVTFWNDEDSTAVLSGFTITNGSGTWFYPYEDHQGFPPYYLIGGGIFIVGSWPTLSNLIIEKNTVFHWAAGMYSHGNCPILNNIVFRENKAIGGFTIGAIRNVYLEGQGGGSYCFVSSPKFSNVVFRDNFASGSGGGIYLDHSSPMLEGVRVCYNSAGQNGGGVAGEYSNPIFSNQSLCNIYSNHAFSGSDLAAGIYSNFNVVLDTFTVLTPTDYYAYPVNNFSFDILHAKKQLVNTDLYVSPNGDDSNSGLTSADPLKTITFAFSKIYIDSLNPHTVHLADGIYGPSTTGEQYPLNILSFVSLSGKSIGGVILDAENLSKILVFNGDKAVHIDSMTITHGSECGIQCDYSNPILHKLVISRNNSMGISCSGSSPKLFNVTLYGNNIGIHAEAEPFGTGSHPVLVNSVVWNSKPNVIVLSPHYGTSSVTIYHSDIKNGINGIYNDDGIINWLSGNISSYPMFVDTLNNDFRLQAGSPCIDAGIQDTMIVYNSGQDTLIVPSIPYYGTAPDMGAYEYGDPTKIEEQIENPKYYSLSQNYPNPFNPSTTIEFDLPKTSEVTLKVFNILGEEVVKLVSDRLSAGLYSYDWDASNLASGVYLYRLQAGDYVETKKMILMR